MPAGTLLLIVGAMLAVALMASLLAGRLRVPGLIAFLFIGMAVGNDGLGWITFNDYDLAQAAGTIGLTLILFEGGMALDARVVRSVAVPSLIMAVFGTILTAILSGVVVYWLLDLTLLEAMLIGSIVAGTDGAAIFAVMRHSTIRKRLARTLEVETGLNDPVAAMLTLSVIELMIHPGHGATGVLGFFAQQVVVGMISGIGFGWLGAQALKRAKLSSSGLYPVASLAIAFLAFGGADILGGAGFLAVFLCGVVLGNSDMPAGRTIATFHEGLAWVAQLGLFLTLGLLVVPSQLAEVAVAGTLLALLSSGVARPLAITLVLGRFDYSFRERLVLGWAGLRGAVPVVLGTFAVTAGVSDGVELFNIVFFAVAIGTLAQAATFEPFARLLGVTTDELALPAPLMEAATVRRLGAEVVQFAVRPSDAIVGLAVRDLQLPRDALLNVIVQNDTAIPPRGSTVIHAGDELHMLVRQEAWGNVQQLLGRWRTGPMRRPPRRPIGQRPDTVFTTGPWRASDGDPGHPKTLGGTEVIEQLRTRRDEAGAVVLLADGRFAYTGTFAASGAPRDLRRAAERRLRLAESDAERAWWREVIGAIALGR